MQSDTPKRPQRGEKFIVRLPDGMREEIARRAKENNRSMNAEIVARLADSLDGESVREEIASAPIDSSVETWANHLIKPEHRDELLQLLTATRLLINSAT